MINESAEKPRESPKEPPKQRESDKELANILANVVFNEDEAEPKEEIPDISGVIKEADEVIKTTNLLERMMSMK